MTYKRGATPLDAGSIPKFLKQELEKIQRAFTALLDSVPTMSAFGAAIVTAVDAAAGRVVLGIGGLATRGTVVITTAALANGASELGSKAIGTATAALVLIAADRACRVRLYSTQAARDTDAARLATTKPTAGTGVLAEFVFAAATSIPVSPVATLTNDENVVSPRVWYNIENDSGALHTVAVTLTIVPLEI